MRKLFPVGQSTATDGDPEIDEDGDEAYAASEYISEGEGYILRLRIAVDMDRAKAVYEHTSGPEIRCAKPQEMIMIKRERYMREKQ